jgi:hypothetical protein
MSELIDTNFKTSKSNLGSHVYRDLSLLIDESRTETKQHQTYINTEITIFEESEFEYNTLRQFFKVHYSIQWIKKQYYDIDRKNNTYEIYNQSVLFNFIDTKVYYEKNQKCSIKNRIKTRLNMIVKHDMPIYQYFKVIERPIEQDYLKYSQEAEKQLEKISYNGVLNKDKVLNTTL